MTDVTRILSEIEQADPTAAEQLLLVVYDELRRLAEAKIANEKPEQTLQATALVHEAYMRLVDQTHQQHWDNSRHFFSAAAGAMRRILIERARRRDSLKRVVKAVENRLDFRVAVTACQNQPQQCIAGIEWAPCTTQAIS